MGLRENMLLSLAAVYSGTWQKTSSYFLQKYFVVAGQKGQLLKKVDIKNIIKDTDLAML